jgi:hypothetical protein
MQEWPAERRVAEILELRKIGVRSGIALLAPAIAHSFMSPWVGEALVSHVDILDRASDGANAYSS